MKKKLYVESSVISYLTARLSKNIQILAKQEATRSWWEIRDQYELYTSQLVLDEIGSGDTAAAHKRVVIIKTLPLLPTNNHVICAKDYLLKRDLIPISKQSDAEHIAIAAINNMDYLVTWNQKHITNSNTARAVHEALLELGVASPLLVQPNHFLEDSDGLNDLA